MRVSLFFKLSAVYWIMQAVLLAGAFYTSLTYVIGGCIFVLLCGLLILIKNKVSRAVTSLCLIIYSSLFLLGVCVVLPFVKVPFIFYVLVGLIIVANFIMAAIALRLSRAAI